MPPPIYAAIIFENFSYNFLANFDKGNERKPTRINIRIAYLQKLF